MRPVPTRQGLENLRCAVSGDSGLPFGPLLVMRTKAEYAALHSGIEFVTPAWERDYLILRFRGLPLENIASLAGVDEYEISLAIGRVARMLATWERNACKWATRYVAIEPQAAARDGASERDQHREHGNRKGST
jgi:hypothetical protein